MDAKVIQFPFIRRLDLPTEISLARAAHIERYTGGIKCEDCGEQIPPRRLKVKPNATRCIDCQVGAEADGWSAKRYRD